MRVNGAVVLVTGANRGLGRALVQAFLDRGAARTYAAMRAPQPDVFADPRVEAVRLDVTDDRSVAALAERCGAVDILVNNAAALSHGRSLEVPSLADARLETETNYFGVLRMCRAFAPHVSARRGAICNILSIGALANIPSSGTYCASKAAAWSLTQSVRAELAPQGVLVAAVFAGPIATDMVHPDRQQGRCPPDVMAAEIVAALERGETRIFPDPRSRAIADRHAQDPWALEAAFASRVA